ncbi:Asp-tRNA(Asn)/Glu-tRNA(Gln) amidotransferase subunit GatA [Gemmatimonas phototrophica]|uniref:Glutamyl-tRNA(Gln) amidotransferase subunit A n=1 Tax=Gemmatimonas phototrophica TaxID=1379270 RepID=A0A143BJS4_9BACT|nr:Asp-tRNA(Asn)/Glu-tRNA(Gln) amidotransferase subunit GatA [Gemmatimonas phototrophica]AMW04853.1 glutamyl-tRNA amidotransferase [Gemmatimonas phototrophica]
MTIDALRAHRVSDAWSVFDAVQAGPDGLNAFLSTDRTAVGNATGSLAGVPVAVKDNLATLHMPTTCGSKILDGYISPFEATAVRKLREAGAAIIGKTNMDEFAMGSSNENSAYGPVRNPVDRTRVPGGSSGGSAAAVASGVVRIALGSETGGSVRQPAAFCGIVGIKPTYGRVSRYGLVAYASSLDNVGVFGATVHEAALGLQVIAGHDRFDSTSANTLVPSLVPDLGTSDRPLTGLVVGKPREYFPASLDPRVAERCERALASLVALGAEVRDVSLPSTELAIPVYYIIAPAEASSNLARYDGVRYGHRAPAADLGTLYEQTRSQGFGAEVTRRILLGTYVLSAGYYDAYYKRAQAVRSLITQEFTQVFASGVHLLFTPTAPTTAFRLGEVSDPYEMYLSDIFTVTANLAGIPAMSLPVGRIDGLPVGGQFMAAPFDEATMLRAAAALERVLGAEAHQ